MSPEDAANFDLTLELGKQLAADLSDSDILGRWMAHHISDLITRAETSTAGPRRDDLRREAMNAIMCLWRHRSTAPTRSRPTSRLDHVLAAVARLSHEQPGRFYDLFREDNQPDRVDLDSAPLLRTALELERTVREFVGHVVVRAAEEATDKEAKWLQLSGHLVEDDQGRALRELARLRSIARRRQFGGAEDQIDDPGIDGDDHGILRMLERTEARLRQVRRELQERMSQS